MSSNMAASSRGGATTTAAAVDHATMLRAAPPKDRSVITAQAINAKRFAAIEAQSGGGSNSPSNRNINAAASMSQQSTSLGSADVPAYNINTIGRRKRAAGQGPTYEEKILASKMLKICAARWTPQEARTDQDIAYEMYNTIEPKLRRSKQPRVLIVMKNRFAGAGLGVMLRTFGCTVTLCCDGARAYTQFLKRDSDSFSMCICDWEFHGAIGGRELAYYEKEGGGTLPFVTIAPIGKAALDYVRQGADLVLRQPIAVHILTLRELLLPNTNQFMFPSKLLGTPSNHEHLSKLLLSMERNRDYEGELLLQQALDQLQAYAELSDFDKGIRMLEQILDSVRRRGSGVGLTDRGFGGESGIPTGSMGDYRNMVNAFRAMMVTFGIMKDDLLKKSDELRLMREYRRRKELGNAYTAAVNAATEALTKSGTSSFAALAAAAACNVGDGDGSSTSPTTPFGRRHSQRGGVSLTFPSATAAVSSNTTAAPSMAASPASANLSSAGAVDTNATSGSVNINNNASASALLASLASLPPLPPLTAESLARLYEPGAFNPYAFIDMDNLTKRDTAALIRKFRNRIAELEAENELTVKELERFAFFKVELEDNLTTNNITVKFQEVNLIQQNGNGGSNNPWEQSIRRGSMVGPTASFTAGTVNNTSSSTAASPTRNGGAFKRTASIASVGSTFSPTSPASAFLGAAAAGPYAALQEHVAALSGTANGRDRAPSTQRAGRAKVSISGKPTVDGDRSGLVCSDNEDGGDARSRDNTVGSPFGPEDAGKDPFDVSPSVWGVAGSTDDPKLSPSAPSRSPSKSRNAANSRTSPSSNSGSPSKPGDNFAKDANRRKSVASEGIDVLRNRTPGESKADRVKNLTRKSIAGIQAQKALQGFGKNAAKNNTQMPLGIGGVLSSTSSNSNLLGRNRSASYMLRQQYQKEGEVLTKRGSAVSLFAPRNGGPASNFAEYSRRLEEARMLLEDPHALQAIRNGDPEGIKFKSNSLSPMVTSSLGISPIPLLNPTSGALVAPRSSVSAATAAGGGASTANNSRGSVSGASASSQTPLVRDAAATIAATLSTPAVPINPRSEHIDKYHNNVVDFVNNVAVECNKLMAKVMAVHPQLRMTLEELSATIRDKIRQLDAVKMHKEAVAANQAKGAGGVHEARLQEQLNQAKKEIKNLKAVHPDAELRRKMAATRQKIFMSQQRTALAVAHKVQLLGAMQVYYKWRQFAMMRRMKSQEVAIRAAAKKELFENKGTFIGQLNTQLGERTDEIASLRAIMVNEAKQREALEIANRSLQSRVDMYAKGTSAIAEKSSFTNAANKALINGVIASTPSTPQQGALRRPHGADDMYSSGAGKKKPGTADSHNNGGAGDDSMGGGPSESLSSAVSTGKGNKADNSPTARSSSPAGKGRVAAQKGAQKGGGTSSAKQSPTKQSLQAAGAKSPSRAGKASATPTLLSGVSKPPTPSSESVAGATLSPREGGASGSIDATGNSGVSTSGRTGSDSSSAANGKPPRANKSAAGSTASKAGGGSSVAVGADGPSRTGTPSTLHAEMTAAAGDASSPLNLSGGGAASNDSISNPLGADADPLSQTRAHADSAEDTHNNSAKDASADGNGAKRKKSVKMAVADDGTSNGDGQGTGDEDVGPANGGATPTRIGALSDHSATPRGTAAVVVSNIVTKDAATVVVPPSPRLSMVSTSSLGSAGGTSPTSANIRPIVHAPLEEGIVRGVEDDDDSDPLGTNHGSSVRVSSGGRTENDPLPTVVRSGVSSASVGYQQQQQPALMGTSGSVANTLSSAKQMVSSSDANPTQPLSSNSRRGSGAVELRPLTPRSAKTAVLMAELQRRGYEVVAPKGDSTSGSISGRLHPLTSGAQPSRPQRVHSAPAAHSQSVRATSPMLRKGPLVPRNPPSDGHQQQGPAAITRGTTGASTSSGNQQHQQAATSRVGTPATAVSPTPSLQPIMERGPLPLPQQLLPDQIKTSTLPNTADEGGDQVVAEADVRPPAEVVIKAPKAIATQTLISFRPGNNGGSRSPQLQGLGGGIPTPSGTPPTGSQRGATPSSTGATAATTTAPAPATRGYFTEQSADEGTTAVDAMEAEEEAAKAAANTANGTATNKQATNRRGTQPASSSTSKVPSLGISGARKQASTTVGPKSPRTVAGGNATKNGSSTDRKNSSTSASAAVPPAAGASTSPAPHQPQQPVSHAVSGRSFSSNLKKPQKILVTPMYAHAHRVAPAGLAVSGSSANPMNSVSGANNTHSPISGLGGTGLRGPMGLHIYNNVAGGGASGYGSYTPRPGASSPARGAGAQAAAIADTLRLMADAQYQYGTIGADEAVVGTGIPSLTNTPRNAALVPSSAAAAGGRRPSEQGYLLMPPQQSSTPASTSKPLSPVVAANLTGATAKAMADISHSLKRLQESTGAEVPINMALLHQIAAKAGEGDSAANVGGTSPSASTSVNAVPLTDQQKQAFQILSEIQRSLHVAAVAAAREAHDSKQRAALFSAGGTNADGTPRTTTTSGAAKAGANAQSIRQQRLQERREQLERAQEWRYKLDEGYIRSQLASGAQTPKYIGGAGGPSSNNDATTPRLGTTTQFAFQGGPDATINPFNSGQHRAFYAFTLPRPTKLQLALMAHRLLPATTGGGYGSPTIRDDGMINDLLEVGSPSSRAVKGASSTYPTQSQTSSPYRNQGALYPTPTRRRKASLLMYRSQVPQGDAASTTTATTANPNSLSVLARNTNNTAAAGSANGAATPMAPMDSTNDLLMGPHALPAYNYASRERVSPYRARSLYTRRRYTPPREALQMNIKGLLPDMHHTKHTEQQDTMAKGKTWGASNAPLGTLIGGGSGATTDMNTSQRRAPTKPNVGGESGGPAAIVAGLVANANLPPSAYDRSGQYNHNATPNIVQSVISAQERDREAFAARSTIPTVPQPPTAGMRGPRPAPKSARAGGGAQQLLGGARKVSGGVGGNVTEAQSTPTSPRVGAANNTATNKNNMLPFQVFKELVAQQQRQ